MNQTNLPPPTRRASDNLCKVLAERYPAQFVEWLFDSRTEPLTVLKTELSREPVRADAVMLLESAAELFHIEFQTTAQSPVPMPFRMLDYYVGLKRRFPAQRIRQALVILKDTGEVVSDHYQDECAFFRYNVIRLWEQDPADIMRHEGLLPLAVLCRTDTKPAQLLRAVAQQIRNIAASDERREQISATQILAGLRFPNSLIYRILKGTDMLEESTVYQDILQRGVQRGLQAGEKQMVLRLIEWRFGAPTPWVSRTIEALPINLVEELGRRLFDLKTVAELRAWLRAHSR